MKLWFCRDVDGECSLWDVDYDKPIYEADEWNSYPADSDAVVVTHDSYETFQMIGKGFYGTRKGGSKLIDVPTKVKVF